MTAGSWTTIRVRSAADTSAVIRALFGSGAEAVEESDDHLVTHVRNLDVAAARRAIAAADPAAEVSVAALPEQDWTAEWRARVTAHRLGRLVVTPPWLAGQFEPAERIVIDPAMAFGTGEHETTRGVLRLLQDLLRPGDVVADLGAGSAVLSIGAVRLGARRAIAIEIDPDAIGNAEANVRANGVAEAVTVIEGDATSLLPLIAPVGIVLANIIVPVLLQLLPVIAAALGTDGRAIFSGILVEERAEFERALRSGGWRVGAVDAEGAWCSIAATRA